MKKYLPVVLAIVLFSACSKKDAPSASTLTGRWYVITDSVAEYTNDVLSAHSKLTFNHQNYLMINSDGSGYQDFIQVTSVGDNVVDDVYAVFNYNTSGSIINFNYPAQTVGTQQFVAFSTKATIKVHTSNTLELEYVNDGVQNGTSYHIVEIEDFTR